MVKNLRASNSRAARPASCRRRRPVARLVESDWNDLIYQPARRRHGFRPTEAPATLAASRSKPSLFSSGWQAVSCRNGRRLSWTLSARKTRSLVLDNADSAAFIAPTPDGPTYMFYMRSANVMAQRVRRGLRATLVGEPVAILDNVGRVANPALTPTLGVSRSGTLAFQKSTSGGAGSPRPGMTGPEKLSANFLPKAVGREPTLSPDGQFAAVRAHGSIHETEDIWVVDLKRGNASRLTFDKERDRNPSLVSGRKTNPLPSQRHGRHRKGRKRRGKLKPYYCREDPPRSIAGRKILGADPRRWESRADTQSIKWNSRQEIDSLSARANGPAEFPVFSRRKVYSLYVR